MEIVHCSFVSQDVHKYNCLSAHFHVVFEVKCPSQTYVCAVKLEKGIRFETCKFFTSKLIREFVFQNLMSEIACMQVYMLLFC